jgi:hypothetical protein
MFDFEVSAAMQALLGRYRDFMTREVHALEASAAGRSFSALAAELAQARERARAEQLFAPQELSNNRQLFHFVSRGGTRLPAPTK